MKFTFPETPILSVSEPTVVILKTSLLTRVIFAAGFVTRAAITSSMSARRSFACTADSHRENEFRIFANCDHQFAKLNCFPGFFFLTLPGQHICSFTKFSKLGLWKMHSTNVAWSQEIRVIMREAENVNVLKNIELWTQLFWVGFTTVGMWGLASRCVPRWFWDKNLFIDLTKHNYFCWAKLAVYSYCFPGRLFRSGPFQVLFFSFLFFSFLFFSFLFFSFLFFSFCATRV